MWSRVQIWEIILHFSNVLTLQTGEFKALYRSGREFDFFILESLSERPLLKCYPIRTEMIRNNH